MKKIHCSFFSSSSFFSSFFFLFFFLLFFHILEGTVSVKPRERGLTGGFVQKGTMKTEWDFLLELFEKFEIDTMEEYKTILRSLGRNEKKMIMTLKTRKTSFDAMSVYETLKSAQVLTGFAGSPVKSEHGTDSDDDDVADPAKSLFETFPPLSSHRNMQIFH